jgi:hypothetical protein
MALPDAIPAALPFRLLVLVCAVIGVALLLSLARQQRAGGRSEMTASI